jgi:6-pyruvoyltetrahydropterin/6-carboxytetrahydropterin synthase
VFVSGPVDPDTGFVQDYADISAVVKPLIEKLDHRHLGTFLEEFEPEACEFVVPPSWSAPVPRDFYPSSENLIVWIGQQLWKTDGILGNSGLDWSKLELCETCTSACTLTREEFDGL